MVDIRISHPGWFGDEPPRKPGRPRRFGTKIEFLADDELVRRLDAFSFGRSCNSRSDAIRDLLIAALDRE